MPAKTICFIHFLSTSTHNLSPAVDKLIQPFWSVRKMLYPFSAVNTSGEGRSARPVASVLIRKTLGR